MTDDQLDHPDGRQSGGAPFDGVLDCHAHVNPDPYVQRVLALGRDDGALAMAVGMLAEGRRRFPLAYGDLDGRLARMDAAGVRMQYLSMAAPYPQPSTAESLAELCRAWNDGAVEIAEQYPGRFAVLAVLPLPHIEQAIRELDRVRELPAVVGITMNTHVAGLALDDPILLDFYARIGDAGTVVFLHPDGFCVRGLLEGHLNWDIGTQLDDTIAATRLIYADIAHRFPSIRWILPHLGGALPFILERLDDHWQRDQASRALKAQPSSSLQNLLFDTAGHGPSAIAYALSVLGPERVVFGSDFPMVGVDDLPETVTKVGTCAAADAAQVLTGNLVRCFDAAAPAN